MSITEEGVENKILKNNGTERSISDKLYASINVQKIVYSFVIVLASGVVFGIGDIVTKAIKGYLNG